MCYLFREYTFDSFSPFVFQRVDDQIRKLQVKL